MKTIMRTISMYQLRTLTGSNKSSSQEKPMKKKSHQMRLKISMMALKKKISRMTTSDTFILF